MSALGLQASGVARQSVALQFARGSESYKDYQTVWYSIRRLRKVQCGTATACAAVVVVVVMVAVLRGAGVR